MKKIFVVASVLLFCIQSYSANLVLNGDFEIDYMVSKFNVDGNVTAAMHPYIENLNGGSAFTFGDITSTLNWNLFDQTYSIGPAYWNVRQIFCEDQNGLIINSNAATCGNPAMLDLMFPYRERLIHTELNPYRSQRTLQFIDVMNYTTLSPQGFPNHYSESIRISDNNPIAQFFSAYQINFPPLIPAPSSPIFGGFGSFLFGERTGTLSPRSGGNGTKNDSNRYMAITRLTRPVKANEKCDIQFDAYHSMGETLKLKAYLANDLPPQQFSPSNQNLSYFNTLAKLVGSQTEIPSDNQWHRVEDSLVSVFKTFPEYNYLIIGDFEEDDYTSSYGRSLYYIDNVELDCSGSTDSVDGPLTSQSLNLYPNPVESEGVITITFPAQSDTIEMNIYNTIGQLVYSKDVGAGIDQTQITLPKVSSGLYILQMFRKDKGKKEKAAIFKFVVI